MTLVTASPGFVCLIPVVLSLYLLKLFPDFRRFTVTLRGLRPAQFPDGTGYVEIFLNTLSGHPPNLQPSGLADGLDARYKIVTALPLMRSVPSYTICRALWLTTPP
jgi:hypothetical protein